MTIAFGLGVKAGWWLGSGLMSYSIVGAHIHRLIRQIQEELLLPHEEIRLSLVETLINELQEVIMNNAVKKSELHEVVNSYQEPIDNLKVNVSSLEERVDAILRARDTGRWPNTTG